MLRGAVLVPRPRAWYAHRARSCSLDTATTAGRSPGSCHGYGEGVSGTRHIEPVEPSKTTRRIGLVLGGGGAVGAAYHAGALTALEQDLGWDARDASVIVGTSAGSLVGALLRMGVPASDMAALTVGASTRDARADLVEALLDRPEFLPLTLGSVFRVPRPPTYAMLFGLLKVSARQRSVSLGALSMMLPEGRHALEPHLALFDGDEGQWPSSALRVCAVRRRDWHRTVFGSTSKPQPRLSAALAASCAVPGYFAGVDIDGELYIDGGVVSPTNADVLGREQIDLAIVVSPMTGTGRRRSVPQLIRRLCRQSLDAELRLLRKRGIPAVVIEPGEEVLEHMSFDFMSEQASHEIVQSAFLDTGTQIRASEALMALSNRGVRV